MLKSWHGGIILLKKRIIQGMTMKKEENTEKITEEITCFLTRMPF